MVDNSSSSLQASVPSGQVDFARQDEEVTRKIIQTCRHLNESDLVGIFPIFEEYKVRG